MAIRSNVGLEVITVSTSDTVLLEPADPVERVSVTAFSLHNTSTTTNITVTIWESPDATSASGERVAIYRIAPGGSVSVIEVIGQGYEQGRNLVAQASAAGVNRVATVTQYDGGS